MTIHASELLAKALKRQGVDTMFYLMGGPMFTAERSCVAEGIRAIDVRHEQAAAMMAHSYARVLNRVGVCMSASGPGALNFGTGLATSLVDCTPVVAIAGSSSLRGMGHRGVSGDRSGRCDAPVDQVGGAGLRSATHP